MINELGDCVTTGCSVNCSIGLVNFVCFSFRILTSVVNSSAKENVFFSIKGSRDMKLVSCCHWSDDVDVVSDANVFSHRTNSFAKIHSFFICYVFACKFLPVFHSIESRINCFPLQLTFADVGNTHD